MNILIDLKDTLLGWKKNANPAPEEEEGRVVVTDNIQVRGNLHRLLNEFSFTSCFAALIALPINQITTFTIALGNIRIPLVAAMELNPNLITLKAYDVHEHDNTFSLTNREGKVLYIRLASKEKFQSWHKAFREALAEMIFTQSFRFTTKSALSIRKIELGIKKGSQLVPPANCHLLRAKRVWNVKVELSDLVKRLTKNPHSVSREQVQGFLSTAEIDRVSG